MPVIRTQISQGHLKQWLVKFLILTAELHFACGIDIEELTPPQTFPRPGVITTEHFLSMLTIEAHASIEIMLPQELDILFALDADMSAGGVQQRETKVKRQIGQELPELLVLQACLLRQYRLHFDTEAGLTCQHMQLGEHGFERFMRGSRRHDGIDAYLHHVEARVIERGHFFRRKKKAVGDEHHDVVVPTSSLHVTNQGDETGMQQWLAPQQVIDHDPEGIEMVNPCLEGRQGYWRGPRDVLIAIATGEVAIIGNNHLGIQCFGVENTFGALQYKLGSRQTSSPYLAPVNCVRAKIDYLDGPVTRIAGPDVPGVPYNHVLEDWFMVNPEKIADAIRRLAAY